MEMEMVYNLINPETGRTCREDNLARKHRIPIGTLVEVKWDTWFLDGACWKVHARLWVVKHTRDCDGSPLYSLSRHRDPSEAYPLYVHGGFAEDSLLVIDVTPGLIEGHGALQWEDTPLDRDTYNLAWWPGFEEQLRRLKVPVRVYNALARAGSPMAWVWRDKGVRLPGGMFIDDLGLGIDFARFVDRALDPAWRERFLSVWQFGDGTYERLQEAARQWKEGHLAL